MTDVIEDVDGAAGRIVDGHEAATTAQAGHVRLDHAQRRAAWLNLRDRFPHPYTLGDAGAWASFARAQVPQTNFAIEVDGEAVGSIGFVLREDVERCSAEIGYWLGEAVWGRGIATGAVRAATAYAFPTSELTRVYALVFERNLASCRVLEKAGYELEGRLRRSAIKDGQVVDGLVYAIADIDLRHAAGVV
jgi:[ribosomal protein S5]-alanine N-acetyltransferase